MPDIEQVILPDNVTYDIRDTSKLATSLKGAANGVAELDIHGIVPESQLPTLEKSASGSLVSFSDGGDNIPLGSLIANITAVQSGSGTPSPSNVRAISGWSGANVSSTGKNLFDKTSLIDQSAWNRIELKVKPNTKYTMSSNLSQEKTSELAAYFYLSTVEVSNLVSASQSVTLTSGADGIVRIQQRRISGSDSFQSYNWQIEEGETSTTYEPFGTTHTIPFGQTVYGGTLDVLSGVLTVTHEIVDLGTLTYIQTVHQALGTYYYADVSSLCFKRQSAYAQAFNNICEKYAVVGRNANDFIDFTLAHDGTESAVTQVQIKNSNCADAAAMKTALNGVKLCYELATPVTYQLTPAQVSTLLGLNNIFADTGDISLSYFTQNANAINDVAESNTRTALNTDVPKTDLTDIFVTGTKNNTGSTISVGTYFYVNNQLALCKSAISANADLTLNTNYELVTVGALNKLMPRENPTGSGTLTMTGSGVFSGGLKINGTDKVSASSGSSTNEVFTSTTTLTYTGKSITCPSGHIYLCSVRLVYANGEPLEIAISRSTTEINAPACLFRSTESVSATFMLDGSQTTTAYIWARYAAVGQNNIFISIVDIKL